MAVLEFALAAILWRGVGWKGQAIQQQPWTTNSCGPPVYVWVRHPCRAFVPLDGGYHGILPRGCKRAVKKSCTDRSEAIVVLTATLKCCGLTQPCLWAA